MRFKLMFAVVAVILLGIFAMKFQVDQHNNQLITQEESRLLKELAKGMARRLGQDMNNRASEIEFLTNMDAIRSPSISLDQKRALFENMKKAYPYYTWIGLADDQGNIVTGTDGLLVGKNVSQRDWFTEGSKGLYFGDAHDAFLLAKLVPKPKWDDLPLRLVDVSAPVLDQNGKILGVVCGHLSVDWAFEARMHMLGDPENINIDLVVLNDKGHVLMGTPFLPSLKTDLSKLKLWQNIANGGDSSTVQETWPDGQEYLSSLVPKDALQSRLPIKWSVVARKSKANILASTDDLNKIFLIAAAVMAIAASLLIVVLEKKNN